jgi:hypothetical protein
MGEAGATVPVSPGASAGTADTANDGNAANDDLAHDIKPSELLQWLRCVIVPATREESALRRCPYFSNRAPVTGQAASNTAHALRSTHSRARDPLTRPFRTPLLAGRSRYALVGSP